MLIFNKFTILKGETNMSKRNVFLRKIATRIFCFVLICTLGVALKAPVINASAYTVVQLTQMYQYMTYKSGTQTLYYRILLPKGYDPNDTTKSYPLVLFLHGAGEKADPEHNPQDVNVKNLWYGLTDFLAQNQDNYPCFVLAPQVPINDNWVNVTFTDGSYDFANTPESPTMKLTVDLINNKLISKYNIDKDRLYVTGFSMGGFGTWDIIMRYPKMFAAAVPICGASDPSKAALIKDVPIWAFHGSLDTGVASVDGKLVPFGVPVSADRDMYAALKNVGANNKYYEDPNADHGIWNNVFYDTYKKSQGSVYDWMFQQTNAAGGISSAITSDPSSTIPNNSNTIRSSSPVSSSQKPSTSTSPLGSSNKPSATTSSASLSSHSSSSKLTSNQSSSSSAISSTSSSLTSSASSSKKDAAVGKTNPKDSNPAVLIIILVAIAGIFVAAAIIISNKFLVKKK